MIASCWDETTRDIFDGVESKAARQIGEAQWPVVQRALDTLHAAHTLADLERLQRYGLQRDRRRNTFTIRAGAQRIAFTFVDGHASHVRLAIGSAR